MLTDRYSNEILQLAKIIQASSKIVFFGGAGVSTESGIPDFRSQTGLYSGKLKTPESPEIMLSYGYFLSNPREFYEFYKDNMLFPDAKPNKAHNALKKLEDNGRLLAIITQNIDGLHFKAGSKAVYELHGSFLRNYCMSCNEYYTVDFIQESKEVPLCLRCGGIVKPDVVFYGEGLDRQTVGDAIDAIESADTLIIGGTSLEVNPAASFLDYFKGESLVIINMSPTRFDKKANLMIRGNIGEVLDASINCKG